MQNDDSCEIETMRHLSETIQSISWDRNITIGAKGLAMADIFIEGSLSHFTQLQF